MDIHDRSNYVHVKSREELLEALKKREFMILLDGNFKKKFLENTEMPLSESERMGFDLGFRGTSGIFSEIFYQIMNLFDDNETEQKKIDSRIRQYKLKKLNNKELLLYLQQLDY